MIQDHKNKEERCGTSLENSSIDGFDVVRKRSLGDRSVSEYQSRRELLEGATDSDDLEGAHM